VRARDIHIDDDGALCVCSARDIRDQVDAYAAAAAVQVITGTREDADAWGAVSLGRSGILRRLQPVRHAEFVP
jgi:hypothetical protein